MTKRGQVAIEFLMTYGWAIVIIVIAVAALAYLGVFSSGTTQSLCEGTAPLNCREVKITDGGDGENDIISFSLKTVATTSSNNNNNLALVSITTGENSNINCIDPEIGNDYIIGLFEDGKNPGLNHEIYTCTLTENLGIVGDNFRGTIRIKYDTDKGLTHSQDISVQGQIEIQ